MFMQSFEGGERQPWDLGGGNVREMLSAELSRQPPKNPRIQALIVPILHYIGLICITKRMLRKCDFHVRVTKETAISDLLSLESLILWENGHRVVKTPKQLH